MANASGPSSSAVAEKLGVTVKGFYYTASGPGTLPRPAYLAFSGPVEAFGPVKSPLRVKFPAPL